MVVLQEPHLCFAILDGVVSGVSTFNDGLRVIWDWLRDLVVSKNLVDEILSGPKHQVFYDFFCDVNCGFE